MSNKGSQRVSRQVAGFVFFVLMIGSGIAAAASAGGNTSLGVQACLGTIIVTLVVLLLGSVVVAANRPSDQ